MCSEKKKIIVFRYSFISDDFDFLCVGFLVVFLICLVLFLGFFVGFFFPFFLWYFFCLYHFVLYMNSCILNSD